MRALLVSGYELGHQPLHLASPAAALLAAGHEVRCLDLSVDPYEPELIDWAEAVASQCVDDVMPKVPRRSGRVTNSSGVV